MQMPSWHLAKPAKTRGSSILKTLGLLGNWVWRKSEWFIWRQRTNQTKTWTSYETNINELFRLIIFHVFQDIIQVNLNCWCFLVHTISSTGSSGKKHCSYWYVVKSKKGVYIYVYINKSKRCTSLVACKQNTSTGIPSYIFILFIPLKFSPNHQIVKEVSFPKPRIDVNCGRIVVPLVYHILPIHSTWQIRAPRFPLKKPYNTPSFKSARTERTCANLGKYPSTIFWGVETDWLKKACYVCWGPNSHDFHIMGDGKINPI